MDERIAQLSRALCADLDTPVSLGVYLRQKYGEWDSYLAMSVDPLHYEQSPEGAEKFRRDSQAVNLLRKYPGLPVNLDTKAAAVRSFWDSEERCARTNARLRPLVENYGLNLVDCRLFDRFVDKVQRRIRRILGPLPDILEPKFGPGSTYEAKWLRMWSKLPSGLQWTVLDKISYEPVCTRGAYTLVDHFIGPTAWGRSLISDSSLSAPRFPFSGLSSEGWWNKVRGNRFTTVKKTAKTDRGICMEPGGNVALQLALGKHIRGRLLRFGIDLDNGQPFHRELARLGALRGEIATMDLSSASDTISFMLVKLFLPAEWFEVLDALASPFTAIENEGDGGGERWVRLEKFSSMGNGFTFELETLLFAAITEVSCEDADARIGSGVWVYGDDIIYPARHSKAVRAALEWCGFIPNETKSFSTGPFRESCGGDYFLGRNVRSYFIKDEPHAPSDWISIVNGLRTFSDDTTPCRNARRVALEGIPSDVRMLRGPSVLGDLVVCNPDPRTWVTKFVDGIRYVAVWKPIQERRSALRYNPSVILAAALYGGVEGGQHPSDIDRLTGRPCKYYQPPSVQPRDSILGYKRAWVPYS